MIETERLLLRPPIPTDVAAIAVVIGDAGVMQYIGRGETGSLADAEDQVERMSRAWHEDGFGRFIVLRKSDAATLGRVGLLAWDPKIWRSGVRSEIGEDAEIELGWTLARHAWGCGYATEAAEAVRDWAIRDVRPRRLISLIHPDNARSKRVATKIGERFEEAIATHRNIPSELWTF